jgi:fibronectin-binding autotransporter adhesin
MILSNATDLRVAPSTIIPSDGCEAKGFPTTNVNGRYEYVNPSLFQYSFIDGDWTHTLTIVKDGSSNGGVANSWTIYQNSSDEYNNNTYIEYISNTGGDWPWLVSWPSGGMVLGGAHPLQATAAIENSDSSVFYVYPETTISRAISGSKQLVKYGSGTLKLSGTHTYTGTTTISAGTLEIASSGSLGSGSYNGSITNNGTLKFTSSTPQTLTGNISGSGSIQARGSLLTLGGNNVFSGGVETGYPSGRLYLTNSSAAGSGNISLQAYTPSLASLSISGGITVGNRINITSFMGGGIISLGSGNNHLSGGMFNVGELYGVQGEILIANGQTSGNLTISNGINGISPTETAANLSLSGSLSANAGFINGPIIISSTGTLINSGVTSWTLNTSAGNSYGFTSVRNRGNIILGTNNVLPTTSRINFDTNTSTGYIDLNGYNQSVRGVASVAGSGGGNGGIITNRGNTDATLSLAGTTANLTYNGIITDGPTNKVNVVLNSSGRTQIFNGNNTYTGTTRISAGTLQIGTTTTGSLSLSSNIINNGTLTFNRTGTVNSGSISGTGNLIKLGTGTLNLSGTNSYTGSTAINAGTLRLNSLVSGPTGKFSLATFSTTVLSAAFISPPSATETYRLLAGSTTNTYAANAVRLVGATGRTGTYNSANSTITIA